MQNIAKQLQKQSSKLLVRPVCRQGLFTVQRQMNREMFAKQNFANKMAQLFHTNQAQKFKSMTMKSAYKFSYPEYTKLKMPALSPSMEKGVIQEWNFKEGDFVEEGSTICEVETDKSTVGFTVLEDMYIAKILVQAGDETDVGNPVAIAVEDEEDVKAFEKFSVSDLEGESAAAAAPAESSEQKQEEAPQQQQQQQQQPPVQQQTISQQQNFASPLARRTAAEQGKDVNQIQGSGPGGRVIQKDVNQFAGQQVQQQQQAPAATSAAQPAQQQQQQGLQFSSAPGENPYIDIPNSGMRKTIAKRLVEAKQQVPHFYLSVDVSVDKLLEVRKELNSQPETKISVNDFVIKAASLALRDYPEANARWFDDKIRLYKNADISVAVSTDGGLITPIVFEANNKGLKEISQNVKDLAGKARQNKLQAHEYQGGTFSISNLGMFGIDHFIAIANPPQACILAVSQSNKKLVYDAELEKEGKEQPFKVSSIMNVTLSCDHRAVDGAVGAQYLQKFKYYIENPTNMLL